jgi:hypothetical protein
MLALAEPASDKFAEARNLETEKHFAIDRRDCPAVEQQLCSADNATAEHPPDIRNHRQPPTREAIGAFSEGTKKAEAGELREASQPTKESQPLPVHEKLPQRLNSRPRVAGLG